MTRTSGRRFASGRARQHWAVVTVLAVSAIAQAVALGAPTLDADSQVQMIPVGYDLSSVTARHADGTVANLVVGRATLLLVFDPDCAHTRRVAPAWSSWLAGRESEGYRILAISPGPLADAIDFANEHHWPIEVVSVEGSAGEPGASDLTRRTPWVIALDQEGRVVTDGHGNGLPEVARALSRGDDLICGDLEPVVTDCTFRLRELSSIWSGESRHLHAVAAPSGGWPGFTSSPQGARK